MAVQILEEDPSCGGALAMLADVCAARARAAAQQQATLHYLLTSTFVCTSAVCLPPVLHWHQHHWLLCMSPAPCTETARPFMADPGGCKSRPPFMTAGCRDGVGSRCECVCAVGGARGSGPGAALLLVELHSDPAGRAGEAQTWLMRRLMHHCNMLSGGHCTTATCFQALEEKACGEIGLDF